ncbi:hypothetical protein G6F43_010293 [Rhizopus delemar]|nr:hypothetical protein G6F43_010293 [Rhizopus delemar]
MSSYQHYEDAKNGFNRAFQTAYKNRFPNNPTKKSADFDISVEFAASQALKSIAKDGMNTLATSTNQAARRLKLKMVCKDPSLSAAAAESSSSTSVPTLPTYRLDNNVEIVEPLQKYINFCKQKSEREGFFVRSDTHQLLASKNIILLKEKEYDSSLLNYIDIKDIELLRNAVSQDYRPQGKLSDNIHSKLTEITRVIKLYDTASTDDERIIDIYLNCLNKLPSFKKTEEISEMELTTNYLDPVLSPIFHNPEKNKHLLWLNRKEENTNHLRPDAIMKHYDRKLYGTTLGYCEVKPSDAHNDVDNLCTDLIRIGIFSRNIMSRKANKIACSLQAVGPHCSFYVLSSITKDITIMNEIISFDVPLQIKELGSLNTIVDELKKMSEIYDNHCQNIYISQAEDQDTNIASIVKPKKRKRAMDVSPITFN